MYVLCVKYEELHIEETEEYLSLVLVSSVFVYTVCL